MGTRIGKDFIKTIDGVRIPCHDCLETLNLEPGHPCDRNHPAHVLCLKCLRERKGVRTP